VIIASDGSTDGTVFVADELVKKHANVHLYARKDRVGKSVVQNAAVKLSKSDIILFSDVDAKFDDRFLERLVLPFCDQRVGCVTGALISVNPEESAVACGTDYYWRFEHFVWRLESRLGLLAWGSGPCLAVRRALFRPMEAQYGEDCIVPLDVVLLGYRVVFQPSAIVRELRIADPNAEMRARIRMTLRSFAGTLSRRRLLNPLRFPGIAWSVTSHKLLRWLTPYFLLLALVSNALLAGRSFYRLTLALQIAFYLGALIGHVLDRRRVRLPIVSTVYAFCVMNVGVFVGVARAISGHQIFAYRSEGER
jgi:cellulose synthase/poly-beta-1,6-N-acetylglucosamine synthase-like glycosyltransferase